MEEEPGPRDDRGLFAIRSTAFKTGLAAKALPRAGTRRRPPVCPSLTSAFGICELEPWPGRSLWSPPQPFQRWLSAVCGRRGGEGSCCYLHKWKVLHQCSSESRRVTGVVGRRSGECGREAEQSRKGTRVGREKRGRRTPSGTAPPR